MELEQPSEQHQWLQQLIGDWTCESECCMGPDQPAIKTSGFDSVKSIGGLWIVCEGGGEMPGGGPNQFIITLGYDPAKKKFVGSFIASCMTKFWLYEGTLEGNVLTLDAEGPSFTQEGQTAKYQDIIELKSPDHRVLSSRYQAEDGTWTTFMTADYWRKK